MDLTHIDTVTEYSESGIVGIVILNRNKARMLLDCIRSIYEQNYKKYIIVVVDNGSTDNSCELIRSNYPEVYFVGNPTNLGVAGGRNKGLEFITGQNLQVKYILFLDNDILVDKYTIPEMISSFRNGTNIGMVTPKLLRPDGIIEYAGGIDLNLLTGLIKNIGYGEKDSGQYDKCSDSISSSGGIFMIRNDVLIEVGNFDENFNPYGWEDVDLSLRVKKKGYLIYYNCKAILFHKGGKSIRGFIKEYEKSKLKNYFYLIRKHSNPLGMFLFYIIQPFRYVIILVNLIKKGGLKYVMSQLQEFYKTIRIV